MGFIYEDSFDSLFDVEFDDIAEEALNKAAPLLEQSMKSALKASIKHSGDSELVNSIKKKKAKKCKNEAWIVNVGPTGYSKTQKYTAKGKGKNTSRKYPVSNALKAIWLEYGIAGKQAAHPFLARAHNDVQSQVHDIIEKTLGEKLEG